jgi:hypothetical protein
MTSPELDKAEERDFQLELGRALLDKNRLSSELAASRERERALERERDEARNYGAQARIRENEAENKRIHEHDRAERAEAALSVARTCEDCMADALALLTRAEAAEAEVKRLREALEPFAKVGRIIDELFGPALFSDDDDAFTTGCEWFVNGKRETLKWGDFRRALADANTQVGDNAAD